MTRRIDQRWCHRRGTYANSALARQGGPLFAPRIDAGLTAFWIAAITALAIAACGGGALIADSIGLFELPPAFEAVVIGMFVTVFAFGPPLLAVLYLGPIRARIRRRVLRARCRLCVRCGHDLTGRPAGQTACPECGLTISTRDAIIYWCRFLIG